jgi:hypothetical protein
MEVEVGEEFASKQEIKNKLFLLASRQSHTLKIHKSDNTMFICVCESRDSHKCKWRLYAKCHDSVWIIKTLENNHTCGPSKQKRSTFGFKEIVPLIKGKIRDCPCYSPKEIQKDLERDHHHEASYQVCFEAKACILNGMNGLVADNYTNLLKFLHLFREKNDGSFVCIQSNPDNTFRRAFISTSASEEAFCHLRPLVSADGTHMLSELKGILLCACSEDALGQVVPLCFALVDVISTTGFGSLSALKMHIV